MKSAALVIGGAGQLGSIVAKALTEKGHQVISADNLSTGDQGRLIYGPLIKANDHEVARISRTITEYKIESIYHCAMPKDNLDQFRKTQKDLAMTLNAIQLAQAESIKSLVVFHKKSNTSEMLERILQDCSTAMRKTLRLESELSDFYF